MKKKVVLFIFIFIFLNSIFSYKYIFLFIGDGLGLNHLTLANKYLKNTNNTELNIYNLEYLSLMNTSSLTGVTDSAAAITAMLSFEKTYNNRLNIDKNEIKLSPITYYLKDSGYRIGLLSTSTFVDPTISGAVARSIDRRNINDIARQVLQSEVDLIISGGRFLSANMSSDKVEILNRIPNSPSNKPELITLYYANFPLLFDSPDRINLVDMIKYMLIKLDNESFFVIIEGARIDHASHANDSLSTIKEIIEFDKAVGKAIEFYLKNPKETLIIVTSDHETGGLSLGDGFLNINNLNRQIFSYETLTRLFIESVNYEDFINKTNIDFDLKEYYEKSTKANANYMTPVIKEYFNNINSRTGIGWTTHGHTLNLVPVFSNKNIYNNIIDNTELLLPLIK